MNKWLNRGRTCLLFYTGGGMLVLGGCGLNDQQLTGILTSVITSALTSVVSLLIGGLGDALGATTGT